MKLMFFRLAAYQESIALLDRLVPDVDSEWKISRPEDQIWILNALAMSCSRMAILSRAHELYDRAIRLAEHHGFRRPLAILLQNLSEDLQCCGDLCGSEKLILRSRDLAIETFDEAILALSFRLRGYILYLIGDIQAESELKSAADLFEKLGFVHPQLYVYTNMAWGSLLLLRPATARLNLTQAEAISQTFQYPREHCTDSLPEG
jgi:tetratricopeptide (TPR) repeat protein